MDMYGLRISSIWYDLFQKLDQAKHPFASLPPKIWGIDMKEVGMEKGHSLCHVGNSSPNVTICSSNYVMQKNEYNKSLVKSFW